MLDLSECDTKHLELVRRVAAEIVSLAPSIEAPDIMVVGATCRDVLHGALGHEFSLRGTQDVDVALALSRWSDYETLISKLEPVRGNGNGIRYRVAGFPVDLVPFGSVEDPTGTVSPKVRNGDLSVWAFQEVWEGSLRLPLEGGLPVRIPSVPGYGALKLCAWLDRSIDHEYKDAPDIAVTLYWYSEFAAIQDRLYETDEGNEALFAYNTDVALASSHLLGQDIAKVIGKTRLAELRSRWPGDREDVLIREMSLPQGVQWPKEWERRQDLLRALNRGLAAS